jgi:hypothetical protein
MQIVAKLLLVRDADTIGYTALAVWQLAKDEKNRMLLGRAGVVQILVQWAAFLLRKVAEEVRVVPTPRALAVHDMLTSACVVCGVGAASQRSDVARSAARANPRG